MKLHLSGVQQNGLTNSFALWVSQGPANGCAALICKDAARSTGLRFNLETPLPEFHHFRFYFKKHPSV